MRRPPVTLEPLESQLLRLAGELEYANRCLAALFEERQDLRLVLKEFDLTDVKELRREVGVAYWRGYRDGYAERDAKVFAGLSPEQRRRIREILGP